MNLSLVKKFTTVNLAHVSKQEIILQWYELEFLRLQSTTPNN